MLELDRFGLWLPGTGTVLDDVTWRGAAGELWGVVGRTGSGASSLLRAVGGSLPPGAHRCGRLRFRRGDVLHISQLPPIGVADYLGALGVGVAEVEALGLSPYLRHRTTAVPPDIRAALLLAALRGSRPAPVVLVDAVLTAAAPRHRELFAAELRRRADHGALVLWADHDLDTLSSVAHHILELDHGRVAQAVAADQWHPATLPEPALRTLARLLDIDVAHSHSTAAVHARARHAPHTARPTLRTPGPASLTIIPAEEVGLTGAPLEFGAAESVGVINLGRRVEPDARRIIARLGGEVIGSHLPSDGRGTGDIARRRVERSTASTTPLWLPHIQAGLDPRERHDLATRLAGENPGVRIVTGRDVEFLVRACRRIIVLDGDRVVTAGTPHAVAELLPDAPLVSRALATRRVLRISDLTGGAA
ncbi:MAG: hypothetical protein GX596_03255 [Propionibacterium sp.]|nr:hypothetical protein [Propionibacterium sp.]